MKVMERMFAPCLDLEAALNQVLRAVGEGQRGREAGRGARSGSTGYHRESQTHLFVLARRVCFDLN